MLYKAKSFEFLIEILYWRRISLFHLRPILKQEKYFIFIFFELPSGSLQKRPHKLENSIATYKQSIIINVLLIMFATLSET